MKKTNEKIIKIANELGQFFKNFLRNDRGQNFIKNLKRAIFQILLRELERIEVKSKERMYENLYKIVGDFVSDIVDELSDDIYHYIMLYLNDDEEIYEIFCMIKQCSNNYENTTKIISKIHKFISIKK